MEIFKAENLSFSYPNTDKKAIADISFSVQTGEFITLCGKSGCGKSTLLRQLKPLIFPYGQKSGSLLFCGKSIDDLSQSEQCEKIGFILQSPESQTVTDKVWHELAFGLEGLGMSKTEIRARVAEVSSFFGIQNWFHQSTDELSGGQKQLLNLASVTVMQPSVLILDEPTAQLDPIAAESFLNMLKKINRELGTTVILSEHRLEEAFAISSRAILMENGRIIGDGSPADIGKFVFQTSNPMLNAMPTPFKVYFSSDGKGGCPITVSDGKAWLEKAASENKIADFIPPSDKKTETDTALELSQIWFRYDKASADILKGLSLKVKKGEFYAIVGGNGTGKTTALSVISSLLKPYRGKIKANGKIALLPQDPKILFTENTVEKDLSVLEKSNRDRLDDVMALCELKELKDVHPYDLSGGEQQRLALAKLLLAEPDILLMDEPTKGLDACFKEKFASIVKDLNENGVTVVAVSHDIEFCAKYADRCGMFFDGTIVSEDYPRRFFSGKSFYTTAACRMAKTTVPNAVLAEDIIAALGKTMIQPTPPPPKSDEPKDTVPTPVIGEKKRGAPNIALILAFISVLFAVPLTIYLGTSLFSGRKYYLISCLIIAETLVPFLAVFERRKPRARELVVISVMCALGVAGRTVFYAFPHFKPVTALVIISGIALGSETGFLVGVITAFVSNFFFGQGPWTVWQMFSFGLIGFISGLLSNADILKKRTPISVFGFFSALLYGLIMNPAAAIMGTDKLTAELIFSFYLTGFPLDLVHGISTFIFLWIAAVPMLEKLERVKIKYGLMR